jgi:hypothetical protein
MGARSVQVLGVKPLVSKHSPQKWIRAHFFVLEALGQHLGHRLQDLGQGEILPGQQRRDLEDRLQLAGLAEGVVFHGRASSVDVLAVYRKALVTGKRPAKGGPFPFCV